MTSGNYKKHNFKGMHKKRLGLLLLVGLLVVVGFGLLPATRDGVQADASDPIFTGSITGWMWSSNIGWIKLDSNNSEPVKMVNGILDGYAWSPSIGWIDFKPSDSTNDYPSGPDRHGVEINISGNSPYPVSGYARACSVFAIGCKGELKDSNVNGPSLGSWDGWIKMISVTYTAPNSPGVHGVFNGYAWGGLNIGWVSLSQLPLGSTEICCDDIDNNGNGATDEGCVCGGGNTISCSVTPSTTQNTGQPFAFTINNAPSDATFIWSSVIKSSGVADWGSFGSQPSNTTNPFITSYSPNVATTYLVSALVSGQTEPVKCNGDVGVTVNPTCALNGKVPMSDQDCCSGCSDEEGVCIKCPPTECTLDFFSATGAIKLDFTSANTFTDGYYLSTQSRAFTITNCNDQTGLKLTNAGLPNLSSFVCSSVVGSSCTTDPGDYTGDVCDNLSAGSNYCLGVKASSDVARGNYGVTVGLEGFSTSVIRSVMLYGSIGE